MNAGASRLCAAVDRKPSTSGATHLEPLRRALRVMVVDDEPDSVVTLLALLRDEGYDAKGFGSGRAALDAVESFDPDVVIADIAMPMINGWDVARAIRRTMGTERPLLIALTGRYTKGADRVLGELSGFDHYLTKPYEPRVLLAFIARLSAT
jgi:DNA-binding response OmpR family regulator